MTKYLILLREIQYQIENVIKVLISSEFNWREKKLA